MVEPTPTGREAELIELSHALAEAPERHVRRAVATIDALHSRGQADHLIAPLRSRLVRLRPARQLNFARLMFLPLDPVIVPAGAWRHGTAGIPRSALAALAAGFRSSWSGPAAAELAGIEAELRLVTTADAQAVRAIGTAVWGRASSWLLEAGPPDGWQAVTGLAQEDHRPIARAVAIALQQAVPILQLAREPRDEERLDTELTQICHAALAAQADLVRRDRAAEPAGSGRKAASPDVTPLATLLAVLMWRSPRADRVLSAAEAVGDGDKHQLVGGQLALDFVLAGMVRGVTGGTMARAADSLRHSVAILADLDTLMQYRPAPRQRLHEARAALDQACRPRLAAALAEVIDAPMHRPPRPAGSGGVAIESPPLAPREREAQARDIRRFEHFARQIGGADVYDAALLDCVDRLDISANADLDAVQRVRLAEILSGPDAAERLLSNRPPG